jgi:cell division protein FtsW (lipid II flippase)
MAINSNNIRYAVLLSAILLLLISLIIVFFVIPPVQNDTFPKATPEKAVIAFWITAAIHFLIALVLIFIFLRPWSSNKRRSVIFTILGIISFLIAFALFDAANAFKGHGPELSTATTLLFICTLFGSIVGISQIVVAVLLRKRKEIAA